MPTKSEDADRGQVMMYLSESWKNYKSDCQYWFAKTSILACYFSPECQKIQFEKRAEYLIQQIKDNLLLAGGPRLIALPLRGLRMLTKLLEKTNPKNSVLQLIKSVGLRSLAILNFIILPLSLVVGLLFQFLVAEPLAFVVVPLVVGIRVLAKALWDGVKELCHAFSRKKQADVMLNDDPASTVTESGEPEVVPPAVLSQFNADDNKASAKLSEAEQLQRNRAELGLAPT